MDELNWHFLELRDPELDVISVFVKITWLFDRVKDKDSAWTYSRRKAPPSIVRLNIVIYQLFLKVVGAITPVLLQIHSQVARYHHTTSVWHEPCRIQIPHERIYERHASATFSPSLNCLHVCLPIVVLSVIDPIGTEYLHSISHAPEPIVVSPEEFIYEYLCWIIPSMLFFKGLCFMIGIPGRESTCGKPWRKLWRIVGTYQLVASHCIMSDSLGLPYVVFTPLYTLVFSSFEFKAWSLVIGSLDFLLFVIEIFHQVWHELCCFGNLFVERLWEWQLSFLWGGH